MDADDRHRAERGRWLEPGRVALLGGEALDEPDRDVVGEAVLEAEAEAHEVDPNRLARAPLGDAGVLDGVGVDHLESGGRIPDVGVDPGRGLAEERPAARRCEHVLVGRAGTVRERDERSAAEAGFEAALRHGGILPVGT